jgi:hypothetical protein
VKWNPIAERFSMQQFAPSGPMASALQDIIESEHLQSDLHEPTAIIAAYNTYHDYITHSPSLHGGAAVNTRLRHTPFHHTINIRRPPWRPLCATHSS